MKCPDKIKYPSDEHAYRMMKIKHRRGLINIRYYKCEVCGNYHLTHKGEQTNVQMDKKIIRLSINEG